MKLLKSTIIFILILNIILFVRGGINSSNLMHYDLDPELNEAINAVTPEFATSLKRRFTNTGVSEEIRGITLASLPALRFSDLYFQDSGNYITLKNLRIQKQPIARLNEIIPNLFEKNLFISADWYNVTVEGSYEMANSSQLKLIPVRSVGNIIIKIENIKTNGLVGFKIHRNALKTTNFDLNFNAENVKVEIIYVDGNSQETTTSVKSHINIDKSIAKYLKLDLYWRLKENLRIRLNHVLQDFSLGEIFEDNFEITSKYVARSDAIDKFLNKVIDQLLNDIRKQIIKNGYDKIPAPDFSTEFSHKFGFVRFWGSFEAVNGTVGDLSTLRRTGKFSVASRSGTKDLYIFGSLGLDNLAIYYNSYYANIWNIGPKGNLKAISGDNSINLKLLVQIRDFLEFDILVKEINVKVEQLDNIKVNATGMGLLLNWLLSYIGTWMTGVYKTEINKMIEENFIELLKKYIPKLTTTFTKNSF